MGKKSTDKGKRGERKVTHLFEQHGYVAHRTAQVDGTLSSDNIVDSLPWLHVEAKWHERVGVFRFWDQAVEDAAGKKTPVLFVKENRSQWLVCVSPQFFFSLLEHAGYCPGVPPGNQAGT